MHAENDERPPSTPARGRVAWGILVLLVIAAGLALRSGIISVSPFVAKYGGDALWALVVFLGFGFLFPRAGSFVLAACALAFSWGIEFSQILHAPWLDALRATLPGRLILGSTFNPPDLAAYALGIAAGVVGEMIAGKSLR